MFTVEQAIECGFVALLVSPVFLIAWFGFRPDPAEWRAYKRRQKLKTMPGAYVIRTGSGAYQATCPSCPEYDGTSFPGPHHAESQAGIHNRYTHNGYPVEIRDELFIHCPN